MANRRGRNVEAGTFEAQAAPLQPLAPVERPRGEAAGAVTQVAAALSAQVGAFADTLAKREGQQAGQIAGQDPAFRPTGGATLRARAFDDAGVETYVSRLAVDFQGKALDLYRQHEKDPAAFGDSYKQLVEQYRRDNVFPEAERYFNEKAQSIGLSLRERTLNNFEENDRSQRRAGLLADSQAAETRRQQLIVVNPNSPETEAEVRRSVEEDGLRIDAQVKAGAITPEQAQKAKARVEQGAVSSLILARAARLKTPDEIEAFRVKTREDFAAGKIKGLADFDQVDGQLEKMARAAATTADHAVRTLDKDLTEFIDRAGSGYARPDEWLAFEQRAASIGPRAQALVETARAKQSLTARLDALPLDRAEQALRDIEARARQGGAGAVAADVLRHGRAHLDGKRKAIATDPLGAAETGGLLPMAPPVDFTADPQQLAAGVAARVPSAEAAAIAFGRAPQYLRPEERERAKAVLQQGGDKALGLIEGIIAGGRDKAVPILRELGGDAPALAQAGLAMARTGDKAFARQVAEGLKARAVPGSKPPAASPTDMNEAMSSVLGTSLSGLSSEEREATKAAASVWAEVEFARRNMDPSGADAKTVLEDAVRRARGMTGTGRETFGGVGTVGRSWLSSGAQVQIPADVRTDKFGDALAAIRDADLSGLGNPPVRKDGGTMSAAELRRLTPIATPGGYRFGRTLANGMFEPVRAKDGQPFTLPWDDLAPELRRRVPAAFR
jgi:hypothetical protein